jgi:hypothetical protein
MIWIKCLFDAGEALRRSTSSLDNMRETRVRVYSSVEAPLAESARCASPWLRYMLTSLVGSGPLRLPKRLRALDGALRVDRRPHGVDRRFRGNVDCRKIA